MFLTIYELKMCQATALKQRGVLFGHMNEVLNSLPLDVAEIRNLHGPKKNLDKAMKVIKHKNLMVPHALNTVKCLVEEICLTLHIPFLMFFSC